MFYLAGAAVGGAAAGAYVAWAIAARFDRIAALTGRADLETHVLAVLCAAGFLIAFPLGAAAGMLLAAAGIRLAERLRRIRAAGNGADAGVSWVNARRTAAAKDRSDEST